MFVWGRQDEFISGVCELVTGFVAYFSKTYLECFFCVFSYNAWLIGVGSSLHCSTIVPRICSLLSSESVRISLS